MIEKKIPQCRIQQRLWLIFGIWLALNLGRAFYPAIVIAQSLSLITPYELHTNLDSWVILDARPKGLWQKAHIPGALSFSWDNYTKTDPQGIPFHILPPKELAAALCAMGIHNSQPIVVYGDADKSWGGEGWVCWALTWLGHRGPIRVLSGGIQAWRAEKYGLTANAVRAPIKKVMYKVNLRPDVLATTRDVAASEHLKRLVDTRSTVEWFLGRIPGAVHINWEKFYDQNRRPISAAEVKNLLQSKGIDVSQSVIYYCTGGVRSAYAWMVHELSGLPPAKNYEGGMEAWKHLSSK